MIIERIPYPGFENLVSDYIENDKPLIIKGLSREKGPLSWTPDLLSKRCGKERVNVSYAKSGFFTHSCKDLDMTLEDFIEKRLGNKSYYLDQLHIADDLPDLLEDIPSGELFSSDVKCHPHLWVSSSDSTTHLHQDDNNNLFFQCYGEKKFILFSPDQIKYLYPGTNGTEKHISPVNASNPDLALFPDFEKTTPIEVTVQAGEVLLIPSGTWHQVTGLSTSVSMNIWFPCFDFQASLPTLIHKYPIIYPKLIMFFGQFIFRKYSSDLDAMNQFLEKGLLYESCICHLALLEYETSELLAPGRFNGGNLKKTIRLCNGRLKDKIISKITGRRRPVNGLDSKIIDEIVHIFRDGIDLLKAGRLTFTDDQSIAWVSSVRKNILIVKEHRSS